MPWDWSAGFIDADMVPEGVSSAVQNLGSEVVKGAKAQAQQPGRVVGEVADRVERIADKAATKGASAKVRTAPSNVPRVSYSSLYGLLMKAAEGAKGKAADLLARAAGQIRASAKAAGKPLAAKASQFTKGALEALQAAATAGPKALKGAADRLGAKGEAALEAVTEILRTIPKAITDYSTALGVVVGGAVVLFALGGGIYLAATHKR